MPHKTLTKDSAWLVYLTSLTEKGVVFCEVILIKVTKPIAQSNRSRLNWGLGVWGLSTGMDGDAKN
ncbi:MAG: hypothetical protein U7123_21935 [Potamolinea sp.]